MSFSYNNLVPAANNNPSVDQPQMLINTQSTEGILAVDHLTFNSNNGGMHQFVHLPAFTTPTVVSASLNEGSVISTINGMADTGYAQCVFTNVRNIPFPMSIIRAYGCVDTNGILINGTNLGTITKDTSGMNIVFEFDLPAGVVSASGNNIGIIATPGVISLNPGVMAEYSIGYHGHTFGVAFRTFAGGATIAPSYFTVVVFQI